MNEVPFDREHFNPVGFLLFVAAHFAAIGGVMLVGWSPQLVALAVLSYLVRMWAVTAGYHRYFSHRTFKTSRVFQFILAFIGACAAQKGVLWWAAHHRHHHRHSDQELDIHSPTVTGFIWAHVGWILSGKYMETHYDKIQGLRQVSGAALAEPSLLPGADRHARSSLDLFRRRGLRLGGSGRDRLPVARHVHHQLPRPSDRQAALRHSRHQQEQPCPGTDHPRARAGTTNHHYYPGATRQGFYWWEIDLTYYSLKVLSWFGIVWDLNEVPERVLAKGRRPLGQEAEAFGSP